MPVFEPSRFGKTVPADRRSTSRRRPKDDEARFLRSWLERPLLTGAVMPSGKFLAKAMAQQVDPMRPGPVVEIGPGTGPVTEALLARGVPEDRLVLVEYNPDFVVLLKQRFRRATVVQGDAYRLRGILGDLLPEPASAIVSSLPLLTKPPAQRLALLHDAFALMQAGGSFVQFTYSVAPPIAERGPDYESFATNWIFLNIPPARVWVYRQL